MSCSIYIAYHISPHVEDTETHRTCMKFIWNRNKHMWNTCDFACMSRSAFTWWSDAVHSLYSSHIVVHMARIVWIGVIWQCPIKCVLKALAKTSALTEVKKLAGEGGTSISISKKLFRMAFKEQRWQEVARPSPEPHRVCILSNFVRRGGLTHYFPITCDKLLRGEWQMWGWVPQGEAKRCGEPCGNNCPWRASEPYNM